MAEARFGHAAARVRGGLSTASAPSGSGGGSESRRRESSAASTPRGRRKRRNVTGRLRRARTGKHSLHSGLADNTYPKRLRASTSPALLIIDDVGLGQIEKREDEPTAAHTLYNLVDRRHGHASTAITSNIRLRDWGRYLGDATVTAAILARLVMQSLRIDIEGPSYRQHVATDRARKAGIPLPSDDTASPPAADS